MVRRLISSRFAPHRLSPDRLLLILLFVCCAFVVPASVAQTASGLLITEVYYDTPGTDEEEEWIEIANLGTSVIALEGYGLGDEEEVGGGEGMLRFPPDASVRPGQVLIVAQTASAFQRLFGRLPDYEIRQSDPDVPHMESDPTWASGSLGLSNGGDEVLLIDADGAIVDAVSYGDSTFFFAPSVGTVPRGHSVERAPASCDSDTAADWKPASVPTPGKELLQGNCVTLADLQTNGEPISIGIIQGAGDRSPFVNQEVTFRGIVTGVQEDRNARGVIFYTMFVQDSPGASDGAANTSDAIPVFLARNRPPAVPGDEVQVSGRVTEFYGLTEIDYDGLQVQVLSRDNDLPPLVPVPAFSGAQELEALEGMRVALPPSRVVGPTFSGCGFAVTPGIGSGDPLLRESVAETPGPIVPILYWSDVDCRGFPQVKVGDIIKGLLGPLTYHFDEFKIVLQSTLDPVVHAEPLPPPPAAPSPAPGQISVATFNLNDYFDPVDHTGTDAEPKPTVDELRVKQRKLATVIDEVLGCPTLLGVQEVEHEALLLELADLLRERCGFLYDVSHRESADARGIDVALLSQPQRVQVATASLRQACGEPPVDPPQAEAACEAGAAPLFSRPPLVVDLSVDGEPYTVYVNHFKSKREGEIETAPRRQAQAAFLRFLVDERLEQDPQARLIVMGDFNDYAQSVPLQTLTGDRSSDSGTLLFNSMLNVPRDERYTYIFSGVSQLLDTILLSPSLAQRMVSATIAHVNADYPAGLATDGNLPFHASDHDVPLVVLQDDVVEPTATATPTRTPTVQWTREPATRVASVDSVSTASPTATATPAPPPTANLRTPTPVADNVSDALPFGRWRAPAVILLSLVLIAVAVYFGARRNEG